MANFGQLGEHQILGQNLSNKIWIKKKEEKIQVNDKMTISI